MEKFLRVCCKCPSNVTTLLYDGTDTGREQQLPDWPRREFRDDVLSKGFKLYSGVCSGCKAEQGEKRARSSE